MRPTIVEQAIPQCSFLPWYGDCREKLRGEEIEWSYCCPVVCPKAIQTAIADGDFHTYRVMAMTAFSSLEGRVTQHLLCVLPIHSPLSLKSEAEELEIKNSRPLGSSRSRQPARQPCISHHWSPRSLPTRTPNVGGRFAIMPKGIGRRQC